MEVKDKHERFLTINIGGIIISSLPFSGEVEFKAILANFINKILDHTPLPNRGDAIIQFAKELTEFLENESKKD